VGVVSKITIIMGTSQHQISCFRDLLTFDSGPVMESNVCGGMSGSKSTLVCCSLSHNATGWEPRLVSVYCATVQPYQHYNSTNNFKMRFVLIEQSGHIDNKKLTCSHSAKGFDKGWLP